MSRALLLLLLAAGASGPPPGQTSVAIQIQLETDWTTARPKTGDVWTVTLPDGRQVLTTLAAARSCDASSQSFELRGPDGAWGRLFITSRGVHAFLAEPDRRKVWAIEPTGDGPRLLRVIDAGAANGVPTTGGCRMVDRQLPVTAPSIAVLTGGAKEASWRAAPHTFRLAVSMSSRVRALSPTIEDDLLKVVDFASAVFERQTGMSFCGAIVAEPIDLPDNLPKEKRGELAQLSISSGPLAKQYDLGVLFDHGGGSEAVRGSACDPATSASTVVDYQKKPEDPWRLAHELGHQFGATHTFEAATTDRVADTAIEPNEGRSQLGYPPAPLDGLWFHPVSVVQMLEGRNRVLAQYNTCGRALPTAATPVMPRVKSQRIEVPPGTPFSFTADITPASTSDWLVAVDDATLDSTPGPPAPPFFRSRPPSHATTREFPALESVLAGGTSEDRFLASGRARLFVMARDAIGNVAMAVSTVAVAGKGGFSVPAQAGWTAGRQNLITWSIGDSRQKPFHVQRVKISVFDGTIWREAAKNVQNVGSANICLLPVEQGAQVRVRIDASGASFFAVSPAFSVAAAASAPTCTR